MPNTGLPEAESVHHLKQISLTVDTGIDHTSQRRQHLLKV